jgi:hypothetical protein
MIVDGNSSTLDANGEYVAIIGRIAIEGRGTSKTLNTTGSSSIRFWVGTTPVFDHGDSRFRVGFQGIDKTTGIPVRPDGSWSAYAVISTGADATPALTTASNPGHVIVPTAGTMTVSHGDEVCFVMEMTTRGDALDSVASRAARFVPSQYPASVTNTSGAAVGDQARSVAVVITFSDGTKGTIDCTLPGVASFVAYDNTANPDEYGLIFQVPFACSVDAMMFYGRPVSGVTSDFTYDLVRDAEGTPVSMLGGGAITITAENLTIASTDGSVLLPFASEVALLANTDYCMAIKATDTTGDVRFVQLYIGDADAREFLGPGGLTMRAVSRNGGTGAYAATADSTTLLNAMAVRISDITTGGGGIITHPGMAGGMRG